ncbi:MAG: c-type cytochrome domain-containing protein [Planctomycetota bacterium]
MNSPVNHICKFASAIIVFLLAIAGASNSFAQDDINRRERRELERIAAEIQTAGQQYTVQDFEASARTIKEANERMVRLTEEADAELIQAAAPLHNQLTQARTMLMEQGADPGEIQALPSPMQDPENTDPDAPVSFVRHVAPIIVAKCGRCHVQGRRGGFSFASFNALDNSTAVTPGNAPQSRLIEVIESGEMPQGGLRIEPAELETLKKWIAAGAEFDGDDPDANLATLGNATPPPEPERMPTPEVQAATGNESVSFGLHVAPILLENCSGCHIDTTNPRGNFSMANFQQLLRGGDSGPPIRPGSAAQSTLFHRLTGANGAEIMPPTGKIADDKIAVVETWINEGAKFDGRAPRTSMQTIAATALAASQSHEDLVAARQELALRNWKMVMTDTPHDEAVTENFYVLGTADPEVLEEIGDIAEDMVSDLKRSLRADEDGPLVKGNIAIFVFQSRYDFSEFGTMIENRPIPRELSSHWGFDTIDAYAVVLMTRNQDPGDIKVRIATAVSSAYAASQGADVPAWFADGAGHWMASRVYPREDEVKEWESQAEIVMNNMENPGDFVTGRIPEHQAALVSYLFVNKLRGSTGSFRRLLGNLREGIPFDDSFAEAFGQTPAEMLGANPPRRRGRN